ncbi:MAG: UDP-2,3-diacylglucosamine diphosphatase [Chitinophagales bacterium]|jgi:UDP-2,3-diacylglucosamine hydrolase|nr:UDP-2,3-diacylglucosamine diphosphatase [Chitinophagales bacterium]
MNKDVVLMVSDLHLGAPDMETSLIREKHFCQLLQTYRPKLKALYLLGDVFDFWFDYRSVSPKGYHRFWGELMNLIDDQIEIHYFLGNHDMWLCIDYFKSIGIIVHSEKKIIELYGKTYFLAHGDGLGPKDYKYKNLKKIFRCKLAQNMFGLIHPNLGIWLGSKLSNKSRNSQKKEEFISLENEWLFTYVKKKFLTQPCDYYIFGHRHLPLHIEFNQKSNYINLGDWINYFTFVEINPSQTRLRKYAPNDNEIIDYTEHHFLDAL